MDRISRIRRIRVTPAAARLSNSVPANIATGTIGSQQSSVKYPVMIAAKSASSDDDLEFEFPFPPQQVSYSDLAPEIAQIQRPGRTPIIAFNRFKARQVNIRFLVAVPYDGLLIDVENDIATLQCIACSGRPVWFYNFDKFFANVTGRSEDTSNAFFWSITDLSFESVRRNSAQKIVQADMNMTLVENTNPNIVVAELPRIQYTDSPVQQNPTTSTSQGREKSFIEYTATWQQFGRPRI
jgi:hypothetical protein